jgi:alpha-galactosidase
MTPDVAAILMNKDVVAIDQDTLGRQGDRVYAEGPIEVWAKQLTGGRKAVAIFNFGESANQMRGIGLHLKEMGFSGQVTAHDVWAAKDMGTIKDDWKTTIPRHASVLMILKK